MNRLTKTLYPWARDYKCGGKMYDQGGPKKSTELSEQQKQFLTAFYNATKHPTFDGNNTSTVVPYNTGTTESVIKASTPSVWQVWQQSTGLPWSKAKELGYTDGSYTQNMALLRYLQDYDYSPNDFDMYNDEYLSPAVHPNQKAALTAEEDYLERAKQNTNPIPYDENNVLHLTNAGKLTGATVPKNLVDSIYKYSNIYNYDPYVMLGIAGQETRFGLDDPYRKNTSKTDFQLASGYDPEVRSSRTITDITNNHRYWISPIRSELNQIARNNNLNYSPNYGVPDNGNYWVFYQPRFNDTFGTNRMQSLIQKTYDTVIPNEYQSIMDSYNHGAFSNMNNLNQTISVLRQSPELQQYLQSISNEYGNGGSIHIKPENRGKFTAAAKRAGKSVQQYANQILANKDHYSSTLVKRANFAKNAKKFHHN